MPGVCTPATGGSQREKIPIVPTAWLPCGQPQHWGCTLAASVAPSKKQSRSHWVTGTETEQQVVPQREAELFPETEEQIASGQAKQPASAHNLCGVAAAGEGLW